MLGLSALANWLRDHEARPEAPPNHPPEPELASADTEPLPPLSPDDEEARYQRAGALVAEGDSEGAKAILADLASHQSIRWEIYHDLGLLHWEAGEKDLSIQRLKNAVALEFSSTQSLRTLLTVYCQQGEIGNALALCRQLLRRDPEPDAILDFLKSLVLETDIRLDDATWVSPRIACEQAEAAKLRAQLDNLTQDLNALRPQAELYGFVKARLAPVLDEMDTPAAQAVRRNILLERLVRQASTNTGGSN